MIKAEIAALSESKIRFYLETVLNVQQGFPEFYYDRLKLYIILIQTFVMIYGLLIELKVYYVIRYI